MNAMRKVDTFNILWEQIKWEIKFSTQIRKDTWEKVMWIPKASVRLKESLKGDTCKRASTCENIDRGSLIFLQNNEDEGRE